MIMISLLITIIFMAAVLAVGIADAISHEIPIMLNIVILAAGVARIILDISTGNVTAGNISGYVTSHVAGFFVVSGVMLIVYIITKGRGIGGGDIKFMASAGLYMGCEPIVVSFVIGCVYACVVSLVLMLFKVIDRKKSIAFGPYLAIGIFSVLMWGKLETLLTTSSMFCILI